MESSGVNRDINRHKFNYQNIDQKLNNKELPWKVLNNILKGLEIRKQYKAFHPYALKQDTHIHKQVWSFYRKSRDNSEKVLTLFNLSSQAITLNSEQIQGIDLFNKQKLNGEITLKAYELSWILIQ
jgi:sucrose phosphorylase